MHLTIRSDHRVNAQYVKKILKGHADKGHAAVLRRFFKTGPGEYGEGDIFLGITVPTLRKLAKDCVDISVEETLKLLTSPLHEERLFALIVFVSMYRAGDRALKEKIYDTYLAHTRCINNWDLVDVSAEHIVGAHLMGRKRDTLYHLAVSEYFWERRIAIMATFHFIKCGDFSDTLRLTRLLLNDGEGLIHKAVGWMLREIGKRDLKCEEQFLKVHAGKMPRVMLRYAIERFPEEKRQRYLAATTLRPTRRKAMPTIKA